MKEANPNLFYVPHGLAEWQFKISARVIENGKFALCAIVDGFNKKRKGPIANHKSLWTAINSESEISWNKQELKAQRIKL